MTQRLFVFLVALLIAPISMAGAQSETVLSPRDQTTIQSVIESQLAAFRRDDGVEAFSYASPGIRARFQTVENFMTMVRNGYPAVYRPREVEMLDLKVRGSTIQQEVLFVGPDGHVVKAVYSMEKQEDGTWRISGVFLLAVDDSTT